MNREQLDKLLEYIDAKINEHGAKDSSDGGLIESIIISKIKQELYIVFKSDQEEN